jgi:hypothetical protein
MVSLLAQGAIDCGLELWSVKIGICCISAKNTDLRSKIKDWFTQKQDNVFANRDMSILVSWRCEEPINRVGKVDIIIIISLNLICYRHGIADKLPV